MGETQRSATARAAIATETIRLDGDVFKHMIDRIPLRLRLQRNTASAPPPTWPCNRRPRAATSFPS